jgi:hypothetical protein
VTQRGGHTLRGPGIIPGRRPPLWVPLTCGGCKTGFVGNAYTVPHFKDAPACRSCWRRLNLILRSANMDEWDTPEDAYPGADPDQVRDEIPRVRHPGLIVPGITD